MGNVYLCCVVCSPSAWKYIVFQTAAAGQGGIRWLKPEQIGRAKTRYLQNNLQNNISSVVLPNSQQRLELLSW